MAPQLSKAQGANTDKGATMPINAPTATYDEYALMFFDLNNA